MTMTQSEYDFIRGLESRSNCSHQEAEYLRQLYAKYVNYPRSLVLNSTCSSCVSEMFQDMVAYVNNKELIITK